MVWFVVFISLFLQYFLNIRSKFSLAKILKAYVLSMYRYFPGLTKTGSVIAMLILVAPPLLVVSLLVLWCHHVMFSWVCFLLSVALYWLLTNPSSNNDDVSSAVSRVETELQAHFAPMFWFVLPFGFFAFLVMI